MLPLHAFNVRVRANTSSYKQHDAACEVKEVKDMPTLQERDAVPKDPMFGRLQ